MARQLPIDDIRAAARDVFARHGYAEATLDRIAEAAGVSRVTLHRRGLTKEALLGQLVEIATRDYRDAMWSELTAAGNAAQRLQRALEALCASAEEHLPVLTALQSRTDDVFHDEQPEPLTRSVFTEPLERLLRDGAADGSLAVTEPVETATVLFNLVGWTYIHLRNGHRWPPERARGGILELALNGLLPRG